MKRWVLKEKEGVKFFRINPSPNLNLVFTTRIGRIDPSPESGSGGVSESNYQSLNLSYDVDDNPKKVDENYARLKKVLGITKIFTLKQIHSNRVFYINRDNINEKLDGDGIFTDEKDLAIGVKVADCLPIYIFDNKFKVIGIAHAGWRSTLAQIGQNLVSTMIQKFSLKAFDLNFVLGPCIEQSCYEVGFELLSQFFNNMPGSERFFFQHNRKLYFDLKGLNRSLLRELGLNEITDLDYCTKCNSDLFYSVRRDSATGRNLGLIWRSTQPFISQKQDLRRAGSTQK